MDTHTHIGTCTMWDYQYCWYENLPCGHEDNCCDCTLTIIVSNFGLLVYHNSPSLVHTVSISWTHTDTGTDTYLFEVYWHCRCRDHHKIWNTLSSLFCRRETRERKYKRVMLLKIVYQEFNLCKGIPGVSWMTPSFSSWECENLWAPLDFLNM